MATTATKKAAGKGRPSAPARRAAGKAASSNGKGPTPRKVAGKAAKAAAKPSGGPLFGQVARKVATKTAKATASRVLTAGAQALRSAADETVDVGRRAVETGMSRRLPIQVSVDVAVPIDFAWEEWMRFEFICEGVDCVQDVEREGDMLFGQIAGGRPQDWEAEILDERPCESFAWRSRAGSDCAGLITFHALGERLTRIEEDLDVVPTNPGQMFRFASHLAHHRAEAELRRFKAHLEFIDPDVYADDDDRGSGDDEPEDHH